jgi:hypothetical protein
MLSVLRKDCQRTIIKESELKGKSIPQRVAQKLAIADSTVNHTISRGKVKK